MEASRWNSFVVKKIKGIQNFLNDTFMSADLKFFWFILRWIFLLIYKHNAIILKVTVSRHLHIWLALA